MNTSQHIPLRAAGVGLLVGIFAGLFSTRAEATSCATADILYLEDPMVIVVSGQGNAELERELLESLDLAHVEGGRQIVMGQESFDLEEAP
jgi:hypothetical protein